MNIKPQDPSLFKFYLEQSCVLPLPLKNDLIYCQRSLRDFLKVHGLVSDVFKEQADADPVQMQRILDELEEEIYEINAEQQYLFLNLNENIDSFYKRIDISGIENVPLLVNNYVSEQIVPFVDDTSYKISPHTVLKRDTEEMLIRKHFLVSQDEDETGSYAGPEQDDSVDCTEFPLANNSDSEEQIVSKKLDEAAITQAAKNCSSNVAVMIVPDSVLKANQRSPNISRCSDEQSLDSNESAAVEKPIYSQFDTKFSSTSPPPLAPIAKVAQVNATDCDSVQQSRLNLRQALRRARKTKQQVRRFDDDYALEELTSIENTPKIKFEPIESVSVTQSTDMLNIIKPESKSKTSKPIAHPVVLPAISKKSNTAQPKPYKTRNAQVLRKSDAYSPPSTSSSEDSNQELQKPLSAQWNFEPRENRVLPDEYGQEPFLGLFGLYTHDVVKKLCQRHSKRKRRTVQNASGIDFHYGQQTAAIDVVRVKKLKSKPEFLLSPKEKRLQAKKANKSAANCKGKSPDKVDEMARNNNLAQNVIAAEVKPSCKECKKRTENLLVCQSCLGYFHSNCHEDAGPKAKLVDKCPQCVRERIARAQLSKLNF